MKKVSEVTKVDRQGVGWRMYLTDFPPCHEMVEAFCSVSLHFTDDVPVAVWHNEGAEREFVSISVDTAHVFFGVDQAKSVREQLDAMFLFSAGVSEDAPLLPTTPASVVTATAPAEPRIWNAFPTQFTEETP